MISETSDAHLKEQRDQSASLDFIALDEANVRIQLALLWSKRWLILTVSVACCAFTTVAAFLVPPKYQASVVLEPVTGWASGGGGDANPDHCDDPHGRSLSDGPHGGLSSGAPQRLSYLTGGLS